MTPDDFQHPGARPAGIAATAADVYLLGEGPTAEPEGTRRKNPIKTEWRPAQLRGPLAPRRPLVDGARRRLPTEDGDAGADHLGDSETDAGRDSPHQGVGPREPGLGGIKRRRGCGVPADGCIASPQQLPGEQTAQHARAREDQLPHPLAADHLWRRRTVTAAIYHWGSAESRVARKEKDRGREEDEEASAWLIAPIPTSSRSPTRVSSWASRGISHTSPGAGNYRAPFASAAAGG